MINFFNGREKMASNKKRFSSRHSKIEPEKKGVNNKAVLCDKCKTSMEFYGVDGNGGLKFNCPNCYEKKNIKIDV